MCADVRVAAARGLAALERTLAPRRLAGGLVVESWTDHLREASRLSGADRNTLARAMAFHQGDPVPPSRHHRRIAAIVWPGEARRDAIVDLNRRA